MRMRRNCPDRPELQELQPNKEVYYVGLFRAWTPCYTALDNVVP